MQGMVSAIRCASLLCHSFSYAHIMPISSAWLIDSTTLGWACPSKAAPKDVHKSIYYLPSRSYTLLPLAREMYNGPLIALLIRAEEHTPPGRYLDASSLSFSFRSIYPIPPMRLKCHIPFYPFRGFPQTIFNPFLYCSAQSNTQRHLDRSSMIL